MRCKTQRKVKNNLEENYFFEKRNKDMLNEKTTIETEVIKAQNPEDLISQVIELQKKGFELFGGHQYNFYMVVMFRESTQQTPDSV